MATSHDTVFQFVRKRFPLAVRRELAADDPLFSSGIIDSFGVLELIAFLEDQFAVSIDPSRHELTEFDTVNKIIELVERVRRAS